MDCRYTGIPTFGNSNFWARAAPYTVRCLRRSRVKKEHATAEFPLLPTITIMQENRQKRAQRVSSTDWTPGTDTNTAKFFPTVLPHTEKEHKRQLNLYKEFNPIVQLELNFADYKQICIGLPEVRVEAFSFTPAPRYMFA